MADIELAKVALGAWAWGNNAQLEELALARDFIEYKCRRYDVASESGTFDTPRNMSHDELPEEIKHIKAKCRINRY